MRFLAVLLMVAMIGCAHAAAPPPGSPQADLMAPFAGWVRGLISPKTGQGCCSQSDCRMVDYRTGAGGFEAYIDRENFPGGPNGWLAVPDDVIIHNANPTGMAVACWAAWHKDSGGWFCFTPASGA